MKYYGYARISTKKQSLDRQIENICKYETTTKIIKEEYTGTTSNRPAWKRLKNTVLRDIAKGEEVTIIFDEVSRMSRNVSEGVAEYFELYKAGISLVFLKEPYINTEVYRNSFGHIQTVGNEIADIYITATNKVLEILATEQITKAFEQAEKEVKDLQQRTAEGMKASGAAEKISKAKTGMNYTTKKSKEKKELIKALSKDFDGDKSDIECIKLCGISRNSYYKYKAELKAEITKEEV